MLTKADIDWSQETFIEGEGFPKDTLGRAQYALFLTNFLANEGYTPPSTSKEVKRNYVLNLNSEWGSGKTYFLKRWSEDLKEHFPTVYIDAWKQDYSDDPLMTVISSVISQLKEQADIDEAKSDFTVPKRVIGLLKAATPALIKTFSKKYFGDEDFIDLSDVAADAVTHLLDEHEEKSKAIDDLKISVAEWVSFITDNPQGNKQYPAFIFIDELDRCRPSYAVEMLETIKHIFDIEGIVFVVATDTEQLQHAVKAIYGEGFNAQLYLGRFFDSRFSLKAPDLKGFLEAHVDHTKLSGAFLDERGVKILPPNPDGKATLRNISVVLDAFKMQPRTAIQIADRAIAILSNMPSGSNIDLLMLTTLLCFYEEDSEQFLRIVSELFESKNEEKLVTYIQNRFHKYKSNILVEVDFKRYGGTLYYNDNKVYEASFFTYLIEIFSSHFDTNETIGFFDQEHNDNPPKKKPFYGFKEALQSCNSEESVAISYLKDLYNVEKYSGVIPAQYQDYVELASALDWIDGDSSSGDA
ncbi:KAP family NTPase [Marinomonas sp. C2222]|uniref:KAP family NTPase n=1 Tax=Marinomonas sargassi TaxID=2984494 RepID=A0ABT2YWH0_9GAMM|nr:KAP family NTPase [Marinomonas sargassi]MCV2404135.1 KAP family NTPase [Marinomonas sargassi]